jgi:hypothetical protein
LIPLLSLCMQLLQHRRQCTASVVVDESRRHSIRDVDQHLSDEIYITVSCIHHPLHAFQQLLHLSPQGSNSGHADQKFEEAKQKAAEAVRETVRDTVGSESRSSGGQKNMASQAYDAAADTVCLVLGCIVVWLLSQLLPSPTIDISQQGTPHIPDMRRCICWSWIYTLCSIVVAQASFMLEHLLAVCL